MNSGVVSILVPMYGVEPYIAQCARSLFSQSYAQCEYIFVDDASKDGTLAALRAVVAEFSQLAPRVKIIESERNGGVAAARNRALDAAQGEYVIFVDADDWVAENIVERLVLRASRDRAQICNAWCESIFEGGATRKTPVRWISPKENHLRAVLEQSHLVPNHIRGMLFARSLFEEHHLRFIERVDFGEDYSLLPSLIYYAERLSTLGEYLYYYREVNPTSYMNNIGARQIENYIAAEHLVSEFVNSLPDAELYARSLLLGRLNIKKWILKRGANPIAYDDKLFTAEQLAKLPAILRLYNRAINSGNIFAVKLLGGLVNLKTLIARKRSFLYPN